MCPRRSIELGARRTAAVDDEGRKGFVEDDGHNEYGREDYELSAGERRDQDRDEGKRLAAPREGSTSARCIASTAHTKAG